MSWRWITRGVSVSAALSVAVACAEGRNGSVNDDDVALDGGDGSDARVALPRDDGGTGTKPGDDSGTGPGPGCTGKVVINELQCNGTGGAELIELFNPTGCAIDLTGWKIPYRSSSGNSGPAIHSFAGGDSIAAGAFLLLGNDKLAAGGVKIVRFNGGGGLGNDGGQIALTDGADKVVDAVGYGPGTSGAYTEGSPAPLPSGSGSIGRDANGTDTDDNASDFTKLATPSPGAAN